MRGHHVRRGSAHPGARRRLLLSCGDDGRLRTIARAGCRSDEYRRRDAGGDRRGRDRQSQIVWRQGSRCRARRSASGPPAAVRSSKASARVSSRRTWRCRSTTSFASAAIPRPSSSPSCCSSRRKAGWASTIRSPSSSSTSTCRTPTASPSGNWRRCAAASSTSMRCRRSRRWTSSRKRNSTGTIGCSWRSTSPGCSRPAPATITATPTTCCSA